MHLQTFHVKSSSNENLLNAKEDITDNTHTIFQNISKTYSVPLTLKLCTAYLGLGTSVGGT